MNDDDGRRRDKFASSMQLQAVAPTQAVLPSSPLISRGFRIKEHLKWSLCMLSRATKIVSIGALA